MQTARSVSQLFPAAESKDGSVVVKSDAILSKLLE